MKNNRILWLQNPDLSKDFDILYKNGVQITPPSNPKYIEAFNTLMKHIEYNKERGDGEVSLYKLSNAWLLKALYETTDTKGRKTPFMYYCESVDIETFLHHFASDSKNASMTYSNRLTSEVKALGKKRSHNRNIVIGIVITLIIIVLTHILITE